MRRKLSLPFAAFVLTLGCLPAGAFEYRQIDDWAVSCDNAYVCTISLNPPAPPEGNADLAAIQWHRSADPSAPLSLSLPFPPGFFQKGDAKGEFNISIDGSAAYAVSIADLVKDEAVGTFGVSDPAALSALFEKMMAGTSATIAYSGGLGDFSSTITLAGLSDGARFVDDLQGRKGRTDALEEKGDGAPPESVSVWSIDTYKQLPPSILRNLSDENSVCYTDEAHLDQADAFGFNAGASTIMLLPCGPSGAYNQPYQLYVGKDQEFHRAEFPNVSEAGITVLDTVYNVNFDLDNRKLSSVYLGRGLGDCGLAHYWSLDEQATGNPLVLTHERAKSACDGKDVGAANWPVTWQSTLGRHAEKAEEASETK
ncbi:DUF1176 domain-containing protein [Martelella radicis]|uniref:DUF1176 domain-containing protein n=1 Tax=Martelella radicis TaxID=1397476 RepID=A0A7W6KQ29_9HYPH|nr:DUF1176 domain-containing protein [Martelella radicis]MBB4124084.1 hypothetical protein [Martelella radicis]